MTFVSFAYFFRNKRNNLAMNIFTKVNSQSRDKLACCFSSIVPVQ